MLSVKADTNEFSSKSTPRTDSAGIEQGLSSRTETYPVCDAFTAAQVVLGNTMVLDMALNGDSQIWNDLQLGAVCMAIDTLFEALFGKKISEEYRVHHFTEVT